MTSRACYHYTTRSFSWGNHQLQQNDAVSPTIFVVSCSGSLIRSLWSRFGRNLKLLPCLARQIVPESSGWVHSTVPASRTLYVYYVPLAQFPPFALPAPIVQLTNGSMITLRSRFELHDVLQNPIWRLWKDFL